MHPDHGENDKTVHCPLDGKVSVFLWYYEIPDIAEERL